MYHGKRDGRGTFRFFQAGMDLAEKVRAQLEAELRTAIAHGEITPYYQPMVSLPARELVGFEVLARWNHATRGLVPPNDFIPIAEETGLIGDLFYSLLRSACMDAKRWPPHLEAARSILTSLQNLGVRIALDDFGTGYSSLYNLNSHR